MPLAAALYNNTFSVAAGLHLFSCQFLVNMWYSTCSITCFVTEACIQVDKYMYYYFMHRICPWE
jgi:hypothetical protein